MVKASFSFPLADVSDIRMQAGLDGGSLMDVGCYCVSGTPAGRGRRAGARATPSRRSAATASTSRFAGTLRFPGDVIGAFHCGFAVGRRHHLEAIGEEGSLFLADPWHGASPVIELRREDGVGARSRSQRRTPTRTSSIDFARAVRGEAPPLLGAPDALGQARVIAALYRSAESGAAVAL